MILTQRQNIISRTPVLVVSLSALLNEWQTQGEEKGKKGSNGKKQEREERRSQLEHGALGGRPERLFCVRGSENKLAQTVQKHW